MQQGITTSEKIGRKILLKYCLISVAIIVVFPIIIVLFNQLFGDKSMSAFTFFKNVFLSVEENELLIVIQVVVLFIGIWFFGGLAGRQIIDKKKSKFDHSFLAIFMLWILLFVSSTISSAVANTLTWGEGGFSSAVIGWLLFGLIPTIIGGTLHGLTMADFMGRAIENEERKN